MEKKKTHRIGYSVRISITISFFSTFSITAAPTSTSSSSRIYANPITWSAKLSNQFWSHSEMSCRTFSAVINESVAQSKTEKSPPLSIVPHIKTPPENNIQQNYSPKIIYTKTKIKLATVNIIKPKPHIQTQTQYTNETKRIKGRWNEKWRKYLVKAFLSFMAIKNGEWEWNSHNSWTFWMTFRCRIQGRFNRIHDKRMLCVCVRPDFFVCRVAADRWYLHFRSYFSL